MTDGAHPRRRTVAGWLLVVFASVSAGVGLLASWADSSLASSSGFADRATAALADDEVNDLLANRLVDRFAADTRLATSARPVAVGLADAVLESDQFAGVFHAAVRTAHEQLVADRDDSVVLALADAAPLLLPSLAPEQADTITSSSDAVVAIVDNPVIVAAAHLLPVARTIAWVCLGLWLACSAGAVALLGPPRRGLRRLGTGLMVTGAVLGVGLVLLRLEAGRLVAADVSAAVESLVRAFTAPLLAEAELLLVLGAVVVMATSSRPPTVAVLAEHVRVRYAAWHDNRLAQGVVLTGTLLLSWWLLAAPLDALTVLARLAGLVLGAVAVLIVLGELTRLLDRGRSTGPVQGAVRGFSTAALTVVTVVVVVATVATAALLPDATVPDPPVADPDHNGCNGSIDLCDRRLDQVALAGSHNAMATTAAPGWFLAEQRLSVVGQLASGVHALMLDVYPGWRSGGVVRTDIRRKETLAAAEDELTAESRAALARLSVTAGAVPDEGDDVRAYLCHGYCELGATDLIESLQGIDDYLAQNPEQVVVLILQDYLTAAETEKVFEQAGVLDRVWPLSVDEPLPLLRDLVESGRTLVVTSENHGGELPWMPDFYAIAEETPYDWPSAEAFACEPARGGTDKPLFLVNHWISNTSSPIANARVANTIDELERRIAQCRTERGRAPTILAVDFVDIGDVVPVVDGLNASGELAR
ncbi:MAG TPA: hypothetical protein VK640_11345 [Actinomycetes bacterium]|nr:hypothetical protein [Actinomycetes bacterium]